MSWSSKITTYCNLLTNATSLQLYNTCRIRNVITNYITRQSFEKRNKRRCWFALFNCYSICEWMRSVTDVQNKATYLFVAHVCAIYRQLS